MTKRICMYEVVAIVSLLSSLIVLSSAFSASSPYQVVAHPKIEAGTKNNWIQQREQFRQVFREQIYGIVPTNVATESSFRVVTKDPKALGGKATLYIVEITISLKQAPKKSSRCFSFPFRLFVPNNNNASGLYPVFLLICNRAESEIDPNRQEFSEYWPVEEILNSGFATAAFWAGDIDPDDQNDDFKNGIHPLLDQGKRTNSSWGTIAAWAWGASRILDVLSEKGDAEFAIDASKVVAIGHSRGGKTALWAAAEDERFAMAVSNDSGCTGAALSKRKQSGNHGETVEQINTVFPNWFCRNYRRYNKNEEELPVDQHLLLALLAPRAVSVASATEDDWADPLGEYLSIRDAAPVWSLFGVDSSLPDQQPLPERPIQSGRIHYHLRSGEHDLNLYDWQQHMNMARTIFQMPPNCNEGGTNNIDVSCITRGF